MDTGNSPHIAAKGASAAPRRVLVTGASGQIGAEFVIHLRQLYGHDSVARPGITRHVILHIEDPQFLSCMAPYDVAPGACRSPRHPPQSRPYFLQI
jgi:nucleoside-diphosphate-sugar epimerase